MSSGHEHNGAAGGHHEPLWASSVAGIAGCTGDSLGMADACADRLRGCHSYLVTGLLVEP